MTQERYQEAAEWLESVSGFEHSHCAVAAKVMRKLASGWVLVPGEPVAWQYWQPLGKLVLSMSPPSPEMLSRADVVITPLYAAAPKP
jgi:hypothetical protein